MLFNSAIVVLSFAYKVVKVQPRKFVRSLYGVPMTLHLVSEVGFANTPIGHRKLNEVTRKDSYPLPRIDDIFDVFHRAKWFCTLDLKS